MFIKRTPSEILNNGLDLLVENTPVNNLYPGAIARTILESFAFEMGSGNTNTNNFYDTAEFILKNAFLSTADSSHLELIGALLDYPRREVEVYDDVNKIYVLQAIDDDTYKYEISRRVHTIASSNEESLRLALLALNGVRDIKGEEYTRGTGSFTFVITPMDGYSNDSILAAAEETIQKVKAYGVRFDIKMPTEINIDMSVQLIMTESSTAADKVNASSSAKNAIENLLTVYDVAQSFVYNDLVQEVMNSDVKIMDFKVLSFYMDGEPVLLMNQSVADDERIRPGNIQIV